MRAERRQPLHNNIFPLLVQPFRIEFLHELLVRGAHVVELAFADIPIVREYLGVGKLLRDFPHARFARLPLLALRGREVFWACAEHAQYRHARVVLARKNRRHQCHQPVGGFRESCLDFKGIVRRLVQVAMLCSSRGGPATRRELQLRA